MRCSSGVTTGTCDHKMLPVGSLRMITKCCLLGVLAGLSVRYHQSTAQPVSRRPETLQLPSTARFLCHASSLTWRVGLSQAGRIHSLPGRLFRIGHMSFQRMLLSERHCPSMQSGHVFAWLESGPRCTSTVAAILTRAVRSPSATLRASMHEDYRPSRRREAAEALETARPSVCGGGTTRTLPQW